MMKKRKKLLSGKISALCQLVFVARLNFIICTKLESTRDEERYISSQNDTLIPYKSLTDKEEVGVSKEMHFTMIDGKVVNTVTETKSAMCYHLCKATSKEFNI